MVNLTDTGEMLRTTLDSHFEWLAVFENGKTIPLRQDEIEIAAIADRLVIGSFDEAGFKRKRVISCSLDGGVLEIQVVAPSRHRQELIRLIPREPASALREHIDAARLHYANAVFDAVANNFPLKQVKTISLINENGRLAIADAVDALGRSIAILVDTTATMNHESLLADALKLFARSKERKKSPAEEFFIAGTKRQIRELRKLASLLKPSYTSDLRFFEVAGESGAVKAKAIGALSMNALWRDRTKKFPAERRICESGRAREIIAMAPDKIDVVFSRNGETLRFRGLPFARVRTTMGHERCWFGTGGDRKPLNEETQEIFYDLVDELHRRRDHEPPDRRHDLFRLGTEAWLESILRRDITKLDANLILAPIHNQFRAAGDRIDLLALRKDGRLVVIEIKATPDRNAVFQAVDYWRTIEIQRRRGNLRDARLFGDLEISEEPALIYLVAPALSFHHEFDLYARMISSDIELWRWELHENWRHAIKVIARKHYRD